MGLLLVGCADDGDFDKGSEVMLPVKVRVSAEEGTRTSHSVDGKDLRWQWKKGDEVKIVDNSGKIIGSLTAGNSVSDDNTVYEFSGYANASYTGQKVRLMYAGTAPRTDLNFDISSQNGSIEGVRDYDILLSSKAQTLSTPVNGEIYLEDFKVKRQMAIARFALGKPGASVTIGFNDEGESGGTLRFNYAGTYWNQQIVNDAKISATADAAGDVYVLFFPSSYVDMTFSVTDTEGNGYEGTIAGPLHMYEAVYYRADDGNGIPVELTKVNGGNNGPEIPAGSKDPIYSGNSNAEPTFVGENGMGWCLNWRSLYNYGGWGTLLTYQSNGIINGVMTSKGGTGIYFQWGRWFGLPSSVRNLIVKSGGSYSGGYKSSGQLPLGINYYNTHIGYCFANSLSAASGCVYAGGSDWTRKRALDASYMFLMCDGMQNHGDYIGANEVCANWEERSGNPAPEGYRIAKVEEYEFLMPSVSSFSGTRTEVKTYNGKKYAMKWTVTSKTSSAAARMTVQYFPTTSSTVSADDSRFETGSKAIFMAMGYLDNIGQQKDYGSVALYWATEGGKTDDGYNGGMCLEIDFSGTTMEWATYSLYRSFGGLVMLVKDENAPAPTPLTPLVPLTGI